MASSKEYLNFILDQLSELEDITYKAMMGEYIIYYRGKIVGGILMTRIFWQNFLMLCTMNFLHQRKRSRQIPI